VRGRLRSVGRPVSLLTEGATRKRRSLDSPGRSAGPVHYAESGTGRQSCCRSLPITPVVEWPSSTFTRMTTPPRASTMSRADDLVGGPIGALDEDVGWMALDDVVRRVLVEDHRAGRRTRSA